MRTLEGTRTPAKLTPDSTRDGWRVERMARSEERRVCRVIRDVEVDPRSRVAGWRESDRGGTL